MEKTCHECPCEELTKMRKEFDDFMNFITLDLAKERKRIARLESSAKMKKPKMINTDFDDQPDISEWSPKTAPDVPNTSTQDGLRESIESEMQRLERAKPVHRPSEDPVKSVFRTTNKETPEELCLKLDGQLVRKYNSDSNLGD